MILLLYGLHLVLHLTGCDVIWYLVFSYIICMYNNDVEYSSSLCSLAYSYNTHVQTAVLVLVRVLVARNDSSAVTPHEHMVRCIYFFYILDGKYT